MSTEEDDEDIDMEGVIADEETAEVPEEAKKAEVSDDEDDEIDEEAAFTDEPYKPGECTVEVKMIIHPDDRHAKGQLVSISATSHGRPGAFLINSRMADLELPAPITEAIQNANGQLEIIRKKNEEKKAQVEAEKQAEKDKAQAAKDKVVNAKKEKLDKAKKKKEEERARIKKKKDAEKAKAQKIKDAEKARAQKAKDALRIQAEKEKAEAEKLKKKTELKKVVPAAPTTIESGDEAEQLKLF